MPSAAAGKLRRLSATAQNRLSGESYPAIAGRVIGGESLGELAHEYGVSEETIGRVARSREADESMLALRAPI